MQYYSQFQQDKFVYENFFSGSTEGFFVDIGAYDGVSEGSNSLFFEKLGWTGICIEPLREQFELLKQNRSCECYNCAISDKDGSAYFLNIITGPKTLSLLVDNFKAEEIQNFENILKLNNNQYEKILVDTRLFSSIVKDKRKVNYLSIDVEGAELSVLKTIDFNYYDIEVLTIENNNNTSDIKNFFADKPYTMVKNLGCDEVYVKNTILNKYATKSKLVIANMYRAKNKSSFFAIHQAINKLPEFDIEFHILWDDADYKDEWSEKIDQLDCKIISYSTKQLDDYCREYGIPEELISKFVNFKAIYFILQGHYLKTKYKKDYYLIYDDDIVFGSDITEFKQCLKEEAPCLIHEPLNSHCDKVMANTLFNLYENSFEYYKQANPYMLGFNAGIQGIRLDIYEDFLEREYFQYLLNLFDYRGIYDENGKEITGPERTMIDTQQQSFFGLMNIIRSKKPPRILTPSEYFVCPNWGHHPIYGNIDPANEYEGWDVNMKSNIIHFIGHTLLEGIYYGKPKQYHKLVDEYLKQHNLI